MVAAVTLPSSNSRWNSTSDICRWTELGLPTEAFATGTKKRIIEAMQKGKQSPAAIRTESGVDYELCKRTLARMAAAGEAVKNGRGFYELPDDPLA